jgi:hypothetical protein
MTDEHVPANRYAPTRGLLIQLVSGFVIALALVAGLVQPPEPANSTNVSITIDAPSHTQTALEPSTEDPRIAALKKESCSDYKRLDQTQKIQVAKILLAIVAKKVKYTKPLTKTDLFDFAVGMTASCQQDHINEDLYDRSGLALVYGSLADQILKGY